MNELDLHICGQHAEALQHIADDLTVTIQHPIVFTSSSGAVVKARSGDQFVKRFGQWFYIKVNGLWSYDGWCRVEEMPCSPSPVS